MNVLEDPVTTREPAEEISISRVRSLVERSVINDPSPKDNAVDEKQFSRILEELQQLRQTVNSSAVIPKNYEMELPLGARLAPPPGKRPMSAFSEEDPPGKRLKRMISEESHQSEFDPASNNMPSCQKCGAYYAT